MSDWHDDDVDDRRDADVTEEEVVSPAQKTYAGRLKQMDMETLVTELDQRTADFTEAVTQAREAKAELATAQTKYSLASQRSDDAAWRFDLVFTTIRDQGRNR